MKNKRNIIVAAILITIIIVVGWRILTLQPGGDAKKATISLVKVETPVHETVRYMLTFSGDIQPMQQASIYSRVNGNLERVYAGIGDAVGRGQTLALIDTTELSQQARQAKATWYNATLALGRNKELAGQNLIARQDLDNADAAEQIARANNEAAQTRLGYAKIIAPFGGYITKRFFDEGSNITSNNSTLFILMALEHMKATINVLESDIPRITLGTTVAVSVDAYPERSFEGRVSRVSQAVDLNTRTMATEVDIPNLRHELKPGMFATVTLVVEEHAHAITVPTYALLKDDKGQFVFVAGDSNRAVRKPVKTGLEQNSRMEIVYGLSGTEKVITTGQQFVRDGGMIKIQ